MKILWRDEYNIGIKEIDEQHRHFFFLMGEVDKFAKAKELDRLGKLLDEIFHHTAKHFSTEEEYFDRYHYKYLREHEAEHRKMIVIALDFKARYEDEGLKIIPEFMDFLQSWMVKHISTSDLAYAPYIESMQGEEN